MFSAGLVLASSIVNYAPSLASRRRYSVIRSPSSVRTMPPDIGGATGTDLLSQTFTKVFILRKNCYLLSVSAEMEAIRFKSWSL